MGTYISLQEPVFNPIRYVSKSRIPGLYDSPIYFVLILKNLFWIFETGAVYVAQAGHELNSQFLCLCLQSAEIYRNAPSHLAFFFFFASLGIRLRDLYMHSSTELYPQLLFSFLSFLPLSLPFYSSFAT
jgi:hypothetical protein